MGSYRASSGWERSECKGLEAVKDRIWNFKH